MDETTRDDIRKLLKSFGVQVDHAITDYIAAHPELTTLHLRLTLDDLTDYGAEPPAEPLGFQIEGSVRI